MKLTVGAYAAFPSLHQGPQPELDSQFMDGLRSFPEIGGLEIPFFGETPDHLSLLKSEDSKWSHVLTLIPGVMNHLKKDALFGLASKDDHGRLRALDFYREAHQALIETNNRLGRRAFSLVEVHSAPQLGKQGVVSSSTEALIRSLDTLRELDWQGAELAIEHCDAFIPNQVPSKGFLPLDREIDAIQGSSGRTPCGILINWGRSAIEGRSAQTPLDHLLKVKKTGLLRGLIFSGATPTNPLYGDWVDSHAPFDAENSLLTAETARLAVKTAGGIQGLRVYGLKMQTLPATMTVPERLEFMKKNIALTIRAIE